MPTAYRPRRNRLDVDLNGDGSFTDPGDQNYFTATLTTAPAR